MTKMTTVLLSASVAMALISGAGLFGRTGLARRGAAQNLETRQTSEATMGGPRPEIVLPLPTGPEVVTTLDEAALMSQLRSVQDSDPGRALELAHEGNRRFPESAAAAERSAILVKSLSRQGKLSEARGEAEAMVNRYAGTPWAVEVELHTGAHPHTDHHQP